MLVFDSHDTRFLVLRNDPRLEFTDVLVPGYGCCRVQRSETVVMETTPLREWILDQHSIRSMALGLLDVSEAELSRMLDFLRLVGRPVTTLRLTRDTASALSTPGRLDLQFLQSLVSSCPQLEELSVEAVPVADASALMDLYEYRGGSIKTLDLLEGVFTDPLSLLPFLQALGSPNLKVACTLEMLSLDLTKFTVADQEDDDTLVLAVFEMLETNKYLRSMHLHCSRRDLLLHASRLKTLRETKIHFQKAPLQLSAKHALLSVASHSHKSPTRRARHRLCVCCRMRNTKAGSKHSIAKDSAWNLKDFLQDSGTAC